MRQELVEASPASVLEVGCGRGAVASLLASAVDYRGYEPDQASYQAALSSLRTIGRGEVVNSTLPRNPDRRFECLLALEVLEHIRDDVSALSGWIRWLSPGALVVVSVPANPERFGPSDERVGHFRRYTRETLNSLLTDAGFEVTSISAWGFPLGYILDAFRTMIVRKADLEQPVDQRVGESGRWLQPSPAAGAVIGLLIRPFVWLQRPFASTDCGIGYVAVARKPLGDES